MPKCLSPKFPSYLASFEVEDPFRQSLKVELFDFDSSSSDDFLGSAEVDLGLVANSEVGGLHPAKNCFFSFLFADVDHL